MPEEARGILNLMELGTIPSSKPSRRPGSRDIRRFLSPRSHSLLLAEREGPPSRVLVVTSPGPAEGKTLMVTNLGLALAESQRRVLLIDADTRNPQLHSRMGLVRDPDWPTCCWTSSP